MTTWFTSDQHFGHVNILSFCGRPFRSVEHMNECLVDNWNAVVEPGDLVYVLGDWAMGKLADSLEYTTRLNGRKILLSGNHDRSWSGHKKRNVTPYLDAGFAEVHGGTPGLVQPWGSTYDDMVTLNHFPYAGEARPDQPDRYVDHRPKDDGRWLLHGHVHDMWRQRGKQINVGVDVWNYTPVSMDTLQDLMEEGPRNLDRDGFEVQVAEA